MDAKVRTGLAAAGVVVTLVGGLAACLALFRTKPDQAEKSVARPAVAREVTPVSRPAPGPSLREEARSTAGPARSNPGDADLPRLILPEARPVGLDLPPPAPEASPASGENDALPAKIVAQSQPEKKEAIDTIKEFLAGHLTGAQSFKVHRYSDPQRIRFKGQKAEVVRVIFTVSDSAGTERPADQLFLIQNGRVKQQANFTDWLAKVQYQQVYAMALQQQVDAERQLASVEFALAQSPSAAFAAVGQNGFNANQYVAHNLSTGVCRH
jgi:hypothetical protein